MFNIHEILPKHDLLYGLLLPLGMSAVLFVIAAIAARKSRESAWAAPLALGGGFAAACIGISGGMPGFPPADSVGWLCYGGAVLAIIGVAVAAMKTPSVVRYIIAMPISLAVMWCVTSRARANGVFPGSVAIAIVLAFALGAAVLTGCIDHVVESVSAALSAFLLAVILAMAANVFGMTGNASLAKETGAIALTLLPAWLIALFLPTLSLRRGMPMVLGPILGGIMVTHYLYSYSEGASPIPSMLILAAIPLLLCITTLSWARRRPRWQFVLINLAAALLPAAIAVAMVAIPFMRAMKENASEM